MKSEKRTNKGISKYLTAALAASIVLLVTGFIILRPVNAKLNLADSQENENNYLIIGDGEFAISEVDGKLSLIPLNDAAYDISFEEINGTVYAIYETFEEIDGNYMSGYAMIPVELP